MTKTIPLEEVLKLATPGKLTADCMRVYTNDGEFWIASTDTPGPATDEEAVANAALLAHKWNHFDDLIGALERHVRLSRHADECESRAETSGPVVDESRCTCWVAEDKAVLARAKTVEMP